MIKPTLLVILDGWGYSDDISSNAIHSAKTPFWDDLWANHTKTLIDTHGESVGLPSGQMGNSEVGHMNIGAGRIVYQNLSRITQAIDDGSFFKNPSLLEMTDSVKKSKSCLHIMGLFSPGGVHSHEDHMIAMLDFAQRQSCEKLVFHLFLDGRDTPPKSARASLLKLENAIQSRQLGKIATVCGRYYAMDRNQNWSRIQKAYDAINTASSQYRAKSALDSLDLAYQRGESDEFIDPTVIGDFAGINDGDAVCFINFRADRARQLTRAFLDTQTINGLDQHATAELSGFICLTEYQHNLCPLVAFPPLPLKNTLGEFLARLGKHQLRMAETEKYAHVTFFFNGGVETPYANEKRTLIPSPDVATYDLQPEMSAPQLTDALCQALLAQDTDLIVCNYANPDMVGHTGVFDAAVKAAEVIDRCLERIVKTLKKTGGSCLITADHGNLEKMTDNETGQAYTSHTVGPVPLVYVGDYHQVNLEPGGALRDLAPTLLHLMGLQAPKEMTGKNLLSHF